VGGCVISKNPLVVLTLFAIVNTIGEVITISFSFYVIHSSDREKNEGISS